LTNAILGHFVDIACFLLNEYIYVRNSMQCVALSPGNQAGFFVKTFTMKIRSCFFQK